MVKEIKEIFDESEKIGVIGSPSSTGGLNLDILASAVNKKLVGNLGVFGFNQDGKDHYALGQITEITMHNVWTQDPTMRGLIRQKGRVDPITEKQDTHSANMMISSVFSKGSHGFEQSSMGTVPSTGTSIRLINENIIEALLYDYQKDMFYLGNAYGTNIRLPMWFKHFGDTESGGVNEAYHIGVFGKNGSGKSVLTKMILLAYSRHLSMSIFILDPQGEFSNHFAEETNEGKFLRNELKRDIKILNLSNLVFDFDNILFQDLLKASPLFKKLTIWYEEHIPRFVEAIIAKLDKINPWEYYKADTFEKIWKKIPDIVDKIVGTVDVKDRIKDAWEKADKEEIYKIWRGITLLFSYRGKSTIRLSEILDKTLKDGTFVIIDLSGDEKPEGLIWSEEIKLIGMEQFLKGLTQHAEKHFKKGGNLNSLVVIDEAHRLAPRYVKSEAPEKKVKDLLTDAIRTTRKYGLGWMFISQTLSSLETEIINQIRIYIFGFGLAWGKERQALIEIIGGQKEAERLYQMFRDPQSSLGKREYPFMTMGPISPLSFSGTPLFFNAFEYPKEFFKINSFKSVDSDK